MQEYLNYNEITKRMRSITNDSVKCKCGHTVLITNKHKRLICKWCGNYVYLNPKDDFENKMKSLMKKVK